MEKMAIMILLVISACFCSQAFSAQNAVIERAKGDVRVVPGGTSTGYITAKGEKVQPGDWIVTGKNSEADIVFDPRGDNSIALGENTIVAIKGRAFYEMEHISGSLALDTSGFNSGKIFGVKSMNKVCRADQATWNITSIDGTVYIIVKDNEVLVNELFEDNTLGETTTVNENSIGVLTYDSVDIVDKKDLYKGATSTEGSGVIERKGVGINESTARELEGIIASE